jgi:hypothetical protein
MNKPDERQDDALQQFTLRDFRWPYEKGGVAAVLVSRVSLEEREALLRSLLPAIDPVDKACIVANIALLLRHTIKAGLMRDALMKLDPDVRSFVMTNTLSSLSLDNLCDLIYGTRDNDDDSEIEDDFAYSLFRALPPADGDNLIISLCRHTSVRDEALRLVCSHVEDGEATEAMFREILRLRDTSSSIVERFGVS